MKTVFYKNFMVFFAPMLSLLILTFILFGFSFLFLLDFGKEYFIYFLLFILASNFLFFLILISPMLFNKKSYLAKLYITHEGIEERYKSKRLNMIYWENILELENKYVYGNYLIKILYKINKDSIELRKMVFGSTKKIKKALIFYCTNEKVKFLLKD